MYKMPVWTPEFMATWVEDRRRGIQCTADTITHAQPENTRYATYHWLWVLGLPGGEKNNYKRSKVMT